MDQLKVYLGCKHFAWINKTNRVSTGDSFFCTTCKKTVEITRVVR